LADNLVAKNCPKLGVTPSKGGPYVAPVIILLIEFQRPSGISTRGNNDGMVPALQQ
jgi:hypothetical protein